MPLTYYTVERQDFSVKGECDGQGDPREEGKRKRMFTQMISVCYWVSICSFLVLLFSFSLFFVYEFEVRSYVLGFYSVDESGLGFLCRHCKVVLFCLVQSFLCVLSIALFHSVVLSRFFFSFFSFQYFYVFCFFQIQVQHDFISQKLFFGNYMQ